MSHSRREFILDVAVAGAALSAGADLIGGAGEASAETNEPAADRCPYFDQPMYCKGLSPNGKPMCDK